VSVFLCGSGGPLPFLTPRDLRKHGWCCMGDAEDGPAHCTCWEPVYDLEQQPIDPSIEPTTRRARCIDCAFRPDSPERAQGDDVEALPNFWCHQGIRRPIAYRHPDGRMRPVEDSADYRPPMGKVAPTGEQVPYRADGTPAERCAGWAQVQRFREVPA